MSFGKASSIAGIKNMESITRNETKLDPGLFAPRCDDIYIVTYPRSGTTWLQMIIYQLTTDGNMDFMHISQHIPFLERAIIRNFSLEHLNKQRALKTHWKMSFLSELSGARGKYIYIYRNGKDVLISYYNFYKDFLGFSKKFEDFFELFMQGNLLYGSWFEHVIDASKHVQSPNVLFLNYEDLVGNFEQQLLKISSFINRPIPPEKHAELVRRCGFSFMKQHESRFDHVTELLWERFQDSTKGTFLRQGKVGGFEGQLSLSQERSFEMAVRAANMKFENNRVRFST